MAFNSQAYYRYLGELRHHLFVDMSLNDIFENINYSHAERRFVNMYLIQDAETFYKYYSKRHHYKLSGVFNQILCAIFHQMDKCPIKYDIAKMLRLKKEMIETPVTSFELKEVTKDLYSFAWYVKKREMSL
jgi:hypothetical protein